MPWERGEKTGPNPTDRRKPGSKHHLLVEGNGVPLALQLTAANRNDITQLLPLVESVPAVRGRVGHPRRRPQELFGDRAYDSRAHRRALRARSIRPFLPKQRTPHGSGLGVRRWPVERSLSWLRQFRRLRVRFDRRSDIHEAFLCLACALIAWRRLARSLLWAFAYGALGRNPDGSPRRASVRAASL